jgi:protein TonB
LPAPIERPAVADQPAPEIVMPVPPPAEAAAPLPSPIERPPVAEQPALEIVTPVPPPAELAAPAPNRVARPPVVEQPAPVIVTPPIAPAPPQPAVARPQLAPVAAPIRARAAPPVTPPKPRVEPSRRTETHAPPQAGAAEPKPAKPALGAARASSPAASSAEISEYQGAVIARLSAAKRYPEAARDRAPHGVAVVRFSIDASGQVAGVSLAQSAGDAMLDAEALATVRRASPFPPPPAGAPRVFSAPLSYRVR